MRQDFGFHSALLQDKRRKQVLFFAGVGFFVSISGTLFATYQLLKPAAPQAEVLPVASLSTPQANLIEVITPLRDLNEGELLSEKLFRTETRPDSLVPPGALKNLEQLRGMYAKSFIPRSLPLFPAQLTTRPTRPFGLDQEIPLGMQAVSIHADRISSVTGLVYPGDKVDLLLFHKQNGQPRLDTVVQNIKVIAVDRVTQSESTKGVPIPTSVTLLTNPEQARAVRFAENIGRLSLTLRNGEDTQAGPVIPPITARWFTGPVKEKQDDYQGKLSMNGEDWLVTSHGLIPVNKDRK